ncbi:ABC transporter ATP-binding protein [Alkalinema sp. FACHB-956]|uniref:ABC transporter ATP-binding protein n=1 Tax=Alkalinema sp. FACHB-956 TaxID=2692768 RepID=UPI001686C506|nr:ABC transporter ATP-binding protein [Alkalinema sp. FACHB-956]MBD2330086.1 ABC transporter ATP-binding protein [Alkalinema sp. FACHB-956]
MLQSEYITDVRDSRTSSAFLEFDRVGLEYPVEDGMRRIIQEVSLSIAPGEFVSFVGPSGCGKTSILRMVSGLAPAPIGAVRMRGETVTKPLRNVGIAFQNPVMMPWRNTISNVMLPYEVVQPFKRDFKDPKKRQGMVREAQKLLKVVGLQDFQEQYPWQLSGGMRQRASLCRALIHQPEILLLDEPFGALDAFTREEMWVMLQELWMQVQCVCILITHDLREAVFLSDTIYVMGPRPSSIVYQVKPNLPRPVTPEMMLSDDFNHIVNDLRRHIHRN